MIFWRPLIIKILEKPSIRTERTPKRKIIETDYIGRVESLRLEIDSPNDSMKRDHVRFPDKRPSKEKLRLFFFLFLFYKRIQSYATKTFDRN